MLQPERSELKKFDLDIETDPKKEQTLFTISPTRSNGMLALLTRLVSTLVIDPGQNQMMVEKNKDGSTYYIDPPLFAQARKRTLKGQKAFITTLVGEIREAKRVSVLRTPPQNT